MQRKGAGDYLFCAPTFKLLDKAAVPYLRNSFSVMLGLGKVVGGSQGRFEVSKQGEKALWGAAQDTPTRIIFGHADEPDSLEAAQFKAAVCDEAGQKKFKQESWEAIQRRLAIDQGRALFPTTPYSLNWLKTEIHDRAKRYAKAVKDELPFNAVDADYEVVNFRSIDNPAFPLDEWERAKATLPSWKFSLFFEGLFTRPAGAIYDCFEETFHKIPAGFIPDPKWRLYCGIDFGAPNFAAVFLAEEPGTKRIIVFAEYRPQESKKLADHVAAMHAVIRNAFKQTAEQWAAMSGKSVSEWTRLPDVTVGGAKAEGQWRAELASAGWPTHPPDQPEVEVQIGRVYTAFKEDRSFISEDCPYLLRDIQEISRPVDEEGNPMEGIEDEDTYHSHAAYRYIVSYLNQASQGFGVWVLS